jgi:hypothetical protein
MELTQPAIQLVLRALSPGVKQPVCEAGHSPLPSAKVRNGETLRGDIGKSLDCYCLTALVTEDERGGQAHTSESL